MASIKVLDEYPAGLMDGRKHYTSIEYRIAGKFDGDLNLANWRFWTATAKVYSRQIYELRTVILPSASHRQI